MGVCEPGSPVHSHRARLGKRAAFSLVTACAGSLWGMSDSTGQPWRGLAEKPSVTSPAQKARWACQTLCSRQLAHSDSQPAGPKPSSRQPTHLSQACAPGMPSHSPPPRGHLQHTGPLPTLGTATKLLSRTFQRPSLLLRKLQLPAPQGSHCL